MKIPPIGTALRIVLCPPSGSAPLELDARVIAARLDPRVAELCCFEVMFGDLDHDVIAQLEPLCGTPSPRQQPPHDSASRVERREYPRVDVALRAVFALDGGRATFAVKNISMSGALLHARAGSLPMEVRSGAVVELTLFDANDSEPVTATALVTRVDDECTPPAVGIRFLSVDERTARSLEGLIVYALVSRGWPDLYRLPSCVGASVGSPPSTGP